MAGNNNSMDALGALVGLGILGSVLDGVGDAEAIKRMTASGRSPIHTPGQQPKKAPLAAGAKAAKETYDSYLAAGFTEVQAFELLKTALAVHKTIL